MLPARRKKQIIPSLFAAIFALGSGATSALAAAPESQVTLQGNLSHAETLPELPPELKVGQVYSDNLLMKPDAKSSHIWFLIPPWYAGTRHCDVATILSRYNYATGETTHPMLNQMNRQDSSAGLQRDREGGIWDFKHIPIIQHIESDFEDAVLFVKKMTPLMGSDQRLMMKYEEISIGINKKSRKITHIIQQEQINTVSSPSPGELRIDVSTKAFDEDGKPKVKEESVIMATITVPFEAKDDFEGEDVRASFKDYLLSHHLDSLVPENLAK